MKRSLYTFSRRVASGALVLLVFFVSNPPTYFTLLLPDLQVSLYLDIPDLDEDVFVRTCASGCDHGACYTYKEESRSDHGRKEKVLFKLKFDWALPLVQVVRLAAGSELWAASISLPSSIILPRSGRPPTRLMAPHQPSCTSFNYI